MTDSVLWSCGTLGKVHGLRGQLYLNLAPGGLDRLELGERFYVAEEGAGEQDVAAGEQAGESAAFGFGSGCAHATRPRRRALSRWK